MLAYCCDAWIVYTVRGMQQFQQCHAPHAPPAEVLGSPFTSVRPSVCMYVRFQSLVSTIHLPGLPLPGTHRRATYEAQTPLYRFVVDWTTRCINLTSALVAQRTVRATIGDRTFPAAAASVWNSLPESVRASPSLQVFRSRPKTELLARSYSCSD